MLSIVRCVLLSCFYVAAIATDELPRSTRLEPQNHVITARAPMTSRPAYKFPKSAWICAYNEANGDPYGCPNQDQQVCVNVPADDSMGLGGLWCCPKSRVLQGGAFQGLDCDSLLGDSPCVDYGSTTTYYADKTTTWSSSLGYCAKSEPFCRGMAINGVGITSLDCAKTKETTQFTARSNLANYTFYTSGTNVFKIRPSTTPAPPWTVATVTLQVPEPSAQITMARVGLSSKTTGIPNAQVGAAGQRHVPHIKSLIGVVVYLLAYL